MIDPMDNASILNWLDEPTKISVFEGADCTGKSTLVNRVITELSSDYNVVKLRFPDNRGDVGLRDKILSSDMSINRLGSVFLFLADFAHGFETQIKPYLYDNDTIFICDRLYPSTCLYQNVSPVWLSQVFDQECFREFLNTMMSVKYFYLIPENMDDHLIRMNNRPDSDKNSYDPESMSEVQAQLLKYRNFYEEHYTKGLLGSFDAVKITV
jgi:thymidylate kinase